MPRSITFTGSLSTSPKPTQSIYTRPPKKPKMSITQTYYLAHSARGKLSKEAARPDHDLRLLVGHANMLDSLMLDLANAEKEQERWFNQTLTESEEEQDDTAEHVETIVEEEGEEDDEEDDEEDGNEDNDAHQSVTEVTELEIEYEDEDEDDEDDDEELALTRTISHRSPPALSQDSDSESEDDDHIPPSPFQSTIHMLSEKQRQSIATTSYYDTNGASIVSPVESETFEQEGFYLPSRQESIRIAAY